MESTEESGSPYEAEGDQDAGQPDHTDSPRPDDSQGTPDNAEEAGDEAGESAAPTESSAH